MKTFITGATGFIGANLCLKLAESGQIVHALFRSERKTSILKHKNIKICKGDLLDPPSLLRGMEACDQVYHLGAFAQVWSRDPDLCRSVNVEGTKNVLDAAVRSGIKKVVITSTAGVFGPSKDVPVIENSVRTEDFFTDYEASKWAMENSVMDYVSKGIHLVIVNPTRVYGPGLLSQANSVTKIMDRYLAGKWRILPGDGSKIGNYAYIDDVVKGHLLAMERGRPGERYILGGEDASYTEFFSTLAEISGKHFKLFKIPSFVMLAFSSLFLLSAKLFGGSPLITPSWTKRYLQDWSVSSQKAEREMGYTITPLREGLQKTFNWLYDKKPL
jgi:nucleoside-diphosphate-sugar epimerase